MWKSKIVRVEPKAHWDRCQWRRRWRRYTALNRLRGTAHWGHSQVHPLRARIMSSHSLLFLAHFITLTLAQVRALSALSLHHHGHPCGCLFTLILSAFYFPAFLPSFFLFPFFHHSEEQQPELNQKIMEYLCYSATNGGEDTYDVLYLPTESTRPRLEGAGHKTSSRSYHWKKGRILWLITVLFTNSFLCLKQWKFQMQRQQWTRNGKHWRKSRRGTWQKSEVRKKLSMKQGRRAESSFCIIDGSLSSQEFGAGIRNTKAESYSEVTLWKMFRIMRSIYWTRIISVPNDSRKSHGYHIQTARVRRTSSRRSIDKHPGQNGRCTDVIENSKVRMCPDIWIRLPYQSTNCQNHGPVWKTQSFLWKGFCMVILWQDYYGKGNLRKSYWNTVGRKFPLGNVSWYIVKQGYSYLCTWMT